MALGNWLLTYLINFASCWLLMEFSADSMISFSSYLLRKVIISLLALFLMLSLAMFWMSRMSPCLLFCTELLIGPNSCIIKFKFAKYKNNFRWSNLPNEIPLIWFIRLLMFNKDQQSPIFIDSMSFELYNCYFTVIFCSALPSLSLSSIVTKSFYVILFFSIPDCAALMSEF